MSTLIRKFVRLPLLTLSGTIVWGMVELLALQRARRHCAGLRDEPRAWRQLPAGASPPDGCLPG